MEEEGEGPRLSKRFSDKGGEVDFKTKAGTAWSHSYLNQKPWHPLSYPNQRRKWIAEQTHANRERRAEEVSREFAQEQEFFRQTALVSKKEKEKMETMKAVSFMYVRPPGYNAESAKAAEIADERRKEEEGNLQLDGEPMSMPLPSRDQSRDMKKKPVPKDVFGRALPTEEQFEVLKNAPRLETGAPARVKPFAVEVRNVKCLRCGNYGHQSGDRECPLKDAIMPNEEIRLKRDDPLTAMLAHTDSSEPLKWELKQKPGMSPPRGGFDPEDPNQQIVADDIFDEYGGFLGGENIPELLANFSSGKAKKKSKSKKKHKRWPSPTGDKSRYHDEDGASSDDDERQRSKERKLKTQKHRHSELTSSDDDEGFRVKYGNNDERKRSKKRNQRHHKRSESHSLDEAEFNKHHKRSRYQDEDGASSDDDEGIRKTYGDDDERKRSKKRNNQRRNHKRAESHSSEDAEFNKKHHKRIRHKHSYSSEDDGRRRSKHHHRSHHHHRQHRYHSDYSSE